MTKLVTLQTGNRSLEGISRRTFGSIALSSLVLLPRPGRAQGRTPALVPTETLDLKKFAHPTEITNKWIPLKPGTRWTYDGTTVEDDGKVVPHQIVHTVTDMTKKIDGIRTVITYDLDISDSELAEAELSFFAQDDDRNVWHFGEYPEVMEDDKLKDTPLWIHGLEGSKAGIMMKADPKLGTPSYSQGYGPKVGWIDRGETFQMDQKVSVKAGDYDGVLVIKESALGEKDAEQLKYYAAGVGNIKVGWTGNKGNAQEVLELTKVELLDAKTMAEIRKKVIEMEKTAVRRSKNVYARLPPAEPNPILASR